MPFHNAYIPRTPAFVYDEHAIYMKLTYISSLADRMGCKLLFPLKCLSITDVLSFMEPFVDGFSASSLFEARLARQILTGNDKFVHITTPGIIEDEIDLLAQLSDFVSFNSLSQWIRFRNHINDRQKCGLRVNPELSFVDDPRYDPCRKHSKLGVPLSSLRELALERSVSLEGLGGIHFHSNCESSDFGQLLKTVERIESYLPFLLEETTWVNIGGGYLFEENIELDKFFNAISLLKDKYDMSIFLEPGKGIVGGAGYIVSSVIDLFENDHHQVAILDTTVNHIPEVFEYEFQPDVMGHIDGGNHKYILAGCTCLAGDVFGEYTFLEPLILGSRVVFANVGAYTLVKSQMFNGVNLPTIYAYTQDQHLEMKRHFTYDDFLSRCGSR
jgi:carboxynorspermidine decarboxylase